MDNGKEINIYPLSGEYRIEGGYFVDHIRQKKTIVLEGFILCVEEDLIKREYIIYLLSRENIVKLILTEREAPEVLVDVICFMEKALKTEEDISIIFRMRGYSLFTTPEVSYRKKGEREKVITPYAKYRSDLGDMKLVINSIVGEYLDTNFIEEIPILCRSIAEARKAISEKVIRVGGRQVKTVEELKAKYSQQENKS